MAVRVRRKAPVALALFAVIATPADAQSFNCRFARYSDEVLICQDQTLGRLDEQMASLYWAIHNQLNGADRHALGQGRDRWLNARRQCGRDRDCIEKSYQGRINELANIERTPRGTTARSAPSTEAGAGVFVNPSSNR